MYNVAGKDFKISTTVSPMVDVPPTLPFRVDFSLVDVSCMGRTHICQGSWLVSLESWAEKNGQPRRHPFGAGRRGMGTRKEALGAAQEPSQIIKPKALFWPSRNN
uniref:Uncharacterized protein n=1 Tax=Bionectria ochroleuca TaxID=29856 RepID=A0A8H7TQ06_BIOOC